MKSITRGAFNIIKKTGNVNRQGSTLEMRQGWRRAPLSNVCEIKIKAKIWLAGREASPLAGQGRHFRIACEEVFGKRHYKRAFDGTKLSKIYRKLNFGYGFGKINITRNQ